jgi:hypothetical protein
MYPLDASEVIEIQKMNRNGIRPESLKMEEAVDAPEFISAVGDDSITRFDKPKKKKKKSSKGKSEQNAQAQAQKPAQNEGQNAPKQEGQPKPKQGGQEQGGKRQQGNNKGKRPAGGGQGNNRAQ